MIFVDCRNTDIKDNRVPVTCASWPLCLPYFIQITCRMTCCAREVTYTFVDSNIFISFFVLFSASFSIQISLFKRAVRGWYNWASHWFQTAGDSSSAPTPTKSPLLILSASCCLNYKFGIQFELLIHLESGLYKISSHFQGNMCRFLVRSVPQSFTSRANVANKIYKGRNEIRLSKLVTEPSHSILTQSYDSRLRLVGVPIWLDVSWSTHVVSRSQPTNMIYKGQPPSCQWRWIWRGILHRSQTWTRALHFHFNITRLELRQSRATRRKDMFKSRFCTRACNN